MSHTIPPLPDAERLREECDRVAGAERLQPESVEKDFHLTRVIWALAQELGEGLLLKGGTCLSKVDLVYLLAGLTTGCTPISVSHYRTAEPLGKGKQEIAAGFQIPKDGDTGTGYYRGGGEVEVDHAPILVLNNLDLEYRLAVTAKTELLAQVFVLGGKVGVRHTWFERRGIASSIGASAGVFSGKKVGSDSTGTYLDFPLTISWNRDDAFAVFSGFTLTRFNVTSWVTDDSLLERTYLRRSHLLQAGAFGGLRIGRTVSFYPGVTLYFEPDEYPIRSLPHRTVYAYPWLGVAMAPATVAELFRRAKPVPRPQVEVEPEPEVPEVADVPDVATDPLSACIGLVFTLAKPEDYVLRSTYPTEEGASRVALHSVAELAPRNLLAHEIHATLPAGTKLEVVHCTGRGRNESAIDQGIAAYLIAQNHGKSRTVLFVAPLGVGGLSLLDGDDQPLDAPVDGNPAQSWSHERFMEIQSAHREDPHGDPAFDLETIVPKPPETD